MNNDAFRKIVQDRSRVKSTKEIARAAVEAEFKRKNKKRRHGGGNNDYSSDSDDEDKHNKKRPNKNGDSFGLYLRPQQVKAGEAGNRGDSLGEADEGTGESKYRDRAKERREGNQAENKDSNDGGESEFLELKAQNTKGLDITQLKEAKQRLKEKTSTKGEHELLVGQGEHTLPNYEEACARLEKLVSDPMHYASLPSGLTEYLTHLYTDVTTSPSESADKAVCGVAGKNIQRSRLVMAIEGCVGDPFRAWERPREVTNPNSQDFLAPPLLTNHLVHLIEKFSAKPKLRRQELAPRKPKTDSTRDVRQSSSHGTSSKSDIISSKDDIGSESVITNQSSTIIGASDKNDVGGSDDDDDDIFGGLDDYIPPKATNKE